jgi:dsRNA-specific ribonuclease
MQLEQNRALSDRLAYSSCLFGKLRDPNISALSPYFDLFIDQEDTLHWDLDSDTLFVNGNAVQFASYFGRADTFGHSTDRMAANYFLMKNYLIAHPEIRRHNRTYERETPTKASNLLLAKSMGLKIPRTVIGQQVDMADSIVKPLTGGHYVVAGSSANYAAIIQERIHGPNRRLFIVGSESFGFQVKSSELDYRKDAAAELQHAFFSQELIDRSIQMAKRLGLSYTALDFVGDYFLEINSMPMFVAFDQLLQGQIAKAIRYTLDYE